MGKSSYRTVEDEFVPPEKRTFPYVVMLQLSAIVAIASFTAVIFSFIALVTSSFLIMEVNSVYYDASDGTRHLVVPQLDIMLGVDRYCVANRCFSRGTSVGSPSLVPHRKDFQNASFYNNAALMDALSGVYEQLVFGYDMGEFCGTSVGSIQYVSQLALATNIIETLSLLVLVITGTLLFFLLTRINVLVGLATVDVIAKDVVVGVAKVSAVHLLREIDSHIKLEGPAMIILLVSASVSFVFSLISMASSLALVESKKCGQSVCKGIQNSLNHLGSTIGTAEEDYFSCKKGISYPQ